MTKLYRESAQRINLLTAALLIDVMVLGVFLYLYPIQKPIPVGGDAAAFITDSQWIADHGTLLQPYQPTYHGFRAYVSPFTDVLLTVLHEVTGLDITYPLFSLYQIFLIELLLATSFLVGRLYGRLASLLFPLSLLGSFSIIRLFMGSTVANLLAFSLVNVSFYCLARFQDTKRKILLIPLLLSVVALYYTHNYLTAPVFFAALLVYFLLALVVLRGFRNVLANTLRPPRGWPFWAILLGVPTVLIVFTVIYLPIVREAVVAFWQTASTGRFDNPILATQYGTYIGQYLFPIGVLGLAFSLILQFRFRGRFYRFFPLLWIGLLLLLLQSYRFGIRFYYERIVFLSGVFLPFFAAYAIVHFGRSRRDSRWQLGLLIAVFIVLVIYTGSQRIQDLYDRSNKATPSQVAALQLLRRLAGNDPATVVYSHENAVSQTAHDIMVSNQTIRYFPLKECVDASALCRAFSFPFLQTSKQTFVQEHVRFFLFMKPSAESNDYVDRKVPVYREAGYPLLYESNDVWLFALPEDLSDS